LKLSTSLAFNFSSNPSTLSHASIIFFIVSLYDSIIGSKEITFKIFSKLSKSRLINSLFKSIVISSDFIFHSKSFFSSSVISSGNSSSIKFNLIFFSLSDLIKPNLTALSKLILQANLEIISAFSSSEKIQDSNNAEILLISIFPLGIGVHNKLKSQNDKKALLLFSSNLLYLLKTSNLVRKLKKFLLNNLFNNILLEKSNLLLSDFNNSSKSSSSKLFILPKSFLLYSPVVIS